MHTYLYMHNMHMHMYICACLYENAASIINKSLTNKDYKTTHGKPM